MSSPESILTVLLLSLGLSQAHALPAGEFIVLSEESSAYVLLQDTTNARQTAAAAASVTIKAFLPNEPVPVAEFSVGGHGSRTSRSISHFGFADQYAGDPALLHYAEYSYQVRFEVTQDAGFAIGGYLATPLSGPLDLGLVQVTDSLGMVLYANADWGLLEFPNPDDEESIRRAVFEPGRQYQLTFKIKVHNPGSGDFEAHGGFDLELRDPPAPTPIPEPGAPGALLLAFALSGLAKWRRMTVNR